MPIIEMTIPIDSQTTMQSVKNRLAAFQELFGEYTLTARGNWQSVDDDDDVFLTYVAAPVTKVGHKYLTLALGAGGLCRVVPPAHQTGSSPRLIVSAHAAIPAVSIRNY